MQSPFRGFPWLTPFQKLATTLADSVGDGAEIVLVQGSRNYRINVAQLKALFNSGGGGGGGPVEMTDVTGLVAALSAKAGTSGQGINAAAFRTALGLDTLDIINAVPVADGVARRALSANASRNALVRETDTGISYMLVANGNPLIDGDWLKVADITPTIADIPGLQDALDGAGGSTMVRSAEQGAPVGGEPPLLVTGDLDLDGSTPVIFPPLFDAGPLNEAHVWTETGTGLGADYYVQWSNGLAVWEIGFTSAIRWRSAVTTLDVTPTPDLATGWAPVSPATGTPIVQLDEPSAGEFLGQFCRVGDSSPYDWYQWDGTAWNPSQGGDELTTDAVVDALVPATEEQKQAILPNIIEVDYIEVADSGITPVPASSFGQVGGVPYFGPSPIAPTPPIKVNEHFVTVSSAFNLLGSIPIKATDFQLNNVFALKLDLQLLADITKGAGEVYFHVFLDGDPLDGTLGISFELPQTSNYLVKKIKDTIFFRLLASSTSRLELIEFRGFEVKGVNLGTSTLVISMGGALSASSIDSLSAVYGMDTVMKIGIIDYSLTAGADHRVSGTAELVNLGPYTS